MSTQKVHEQMYHNNIRVEFDKRAEKVGAKVRDAELMKIPVMLIVGEKEQDANAVSVRRKHQGDLGQQSLDDLVVSLTEEINNKNKGRKEN